MDFGAKNERGGFFLFCEWASCQRRERKTMRERERLILNLCVLVNMQPFGLITREGRGETGKIGN